MSEKQGARPINVVVQSIQQQAVNVRTAAEHLTNRIITFESYLGQLPGRVEAFTFGEHPDDDGRGEVNLCLKFTREGKDWKLFWADYCEEYHAPDSPMDFKPLVDAPLKIKIAAIRMFPDVLVSVEESQVRIIQQLTEASVEFDKFAKQLMASKQEGR
jgi:hypothetical protein